jgi:hypothetical protein
MSSLYIGKHASYEAAEFSRKFQQEKTQTLLVVSPAEFQRLHNYTRPSMLSGYLLKNVGDLVSGRDVELEDLAVSKMEGELFGRDGILRGDRNSIGNIESKLLNNRNFILSEESSAGAQKQTSGATTRTLLTSQ